LAGTVASEVPKMPGRGAQGRRFPKTSPASRRLSRPDPLAGLAGLDRDPPGWKPGKPGKPSCDKLCLDLRATALPACSSINLAYQVCCLGVIYTAIRNCAVFCNDSSAVGGNPEAGEEAFKEAMHALEAYHFRCPDKKSTGRR
jgi:hypothetical protein